MFIKIFNLLFIYLNKMNTKLQSYHITIGLINSLTLNFNSKSFILFYLINIQKFLHFHIINTNTLIKNIYKLFILSLLLTNNNGQQSHHIMVRPPSPTRQLPRKIKIINPSRITNTNEIKTLIIKQT